MKTKLHFAAVQLMAALTADVVPAQERHTAQPTPSRVATEPVLPVGTKVLRNLAYVPNGHERQKLDLYVPSATKPLPLVIWVHGGGWRGGSKQGCRSLPFLEHGYAAASVGYRLSRHAVFPAQIEDCKAAVRWLRAHAREYNLDPERFAAWGSSAGGHLVALLGTSGEFKEFDKGENLEVSSRVQAVVDCYGPTDFTQMRKQALPDATTNPDAPDSATAQLLGGPLPLNQDKAARANPITYASRDDPPFLIMHGNRDKLVPNQQSELLRDALQKGGVDVTLTLFDGAGHALGPPKVDRLVLEWLDQRLKPKAAK